MRSATYSVNIPFMPVFNNLVIYKQDVPQNCMDSIVPDLAESWAWSDDNKKLTFKLRQGVKWHDGKPFTSADVKCTFDMLMGKSQQKFRKNPRKSWYDEVDRRHRQRRLRGILQSEAAAAGAAGAARLRLYAGLSLPRLARRHAHQADRHRPVQIRRVQGQRIHQARPQSGLLEEGPAASRRHRIHHHHQPVDRHSRLYLRPVRHDVPDRSLDPAAQGRPEAVAEGGVRGRAGQRLHQHHRQLVLAAVRQSSTFAARWRWRSTARPSSRSCSKARPTSAAPCCPPPAGYGRCRRRCWKPFRATAPISMPTGRKPAS